MFGITLSTSMNVVLEFGVSFGVWSVMGGLRGPQIFKMSNFFRALYLPFCEFLLQISSYIDLKCLLCVCITVKTQCDKYQYLYKVGSYARSTLSICSLAPWPPPIRKFWIRPWVFIVLCSAFTIYRLLCHHSTDDDK